MTSERDALLSERILDSMRDGVLAIDLTGRIITFNEAAGLILGKDPQEMLGQPFAAEFMADERFDDFNELVLRAVYDAKVVHRTDIELEVGGQRRSIVVASSFLNRFDEDGTSQRFGVVVVFSDATEARKRERLQRLFGEYVDPRIVDQILSRQGEESSRRGDMSISFVDMRDYTGWSERLAASALTDLLNRFLSAVVRPIGEAGGITDKFIGDAAMACWGPPFTDEATHAADACRAALGQIAAVDALREELVEEGLAGAEAFNAVVSVATGDVLAGDIGPPSSRNFTVIGNAVNVAARLQETAKLYGRRIVVAHETRLRAGEAFHFCELDHIIVRGSHRPERIHALLGERGSVPAAALEDAARYEAALHQLQGGAFGPAREAFLALVRDLPQDKASVLMLERAAALAAAPSAEPWDGVWRAG